MHGFHFCFIEVVTKMHLKKQLANFKIQEGETVTQHIQNFWLLIDQMSVAAIIVDNEDQVIIQSYALYAITLQDHYIIPLWSI